MSLKTGKNYEKIAQKHLEKAGLKTICSNFNCKMGEVDLIMQDKEELAFIEVKYRSSSHYGGSLYAVTQSKQKRIIKAAKAYLKKQGASDKIACRFDVVAIEPGNIQWLKDAFWA